MKSLYESILGTTKSGASLIYSKENIEHINYLMRCSTDFRKRQKRFREFLETNNFMLEKSEISNLAKDLLTYCDNGFSCPESGEHSLSNQLKRGPISFSNTGIYMICAISLDIFNELDFMAFIANPIIEIEDNCFFVLEHPSTKRIRKQLDSYFSKHTTVERDNKHITLMRCYKLEDSIKPFNK